jgi:starch synthase
MRAQRYGALPLVRSVGGLADTVDDGATGFVFRDYDAAAFVACAIRTVRAFHDRAAWAAMVRAAMGRDFGWVRSADRYLDVYRRALARAAEPAVPIV